MMFTVRYEGILSQSIHQKTQSAPFHELEFHT